MCSTWCRWSASYNLLRDPSDPKSRRGKVVDGPVEYRNAVREQIANGADWIKAYADQLIPPYRRHPESSYPKARR